MPGETLVIFDYSGTLSTESVLFGRPEGLLAELHRSGLAGLGVDDLAVFWERIVAATWRTGSTTSRGYRGVMEDAVAAMQPQPVSPQLRGRIACAVEAFAERYFASSRLDERWRPLLTRLSREETVRVVVATDHYAEATDVILRGLAQWQIPAVATREAGTGVPSGNVLVANSADLGARKTDPAFWRQVKARLNAADFRSVIVVDDFGRNERQEDRYGGRDKVAKRREATAALLGEVFAADVKIVPFALPRGKRDRGGDVRADDDPFGPLIARVTAVVEAAIAREKGTARRGGKDS